MTQAQDLQDRLEQAEKAIEDHRAAMKFHEMGDDFYSIGGGRKRDEAELWRLRDAAEAIRRQMAEVSA